MSKPKKEKKEEKGIVVDKSFIELVTKTIQEIKSNQEAIREELNRVKNLPPIKVVSPLEEKKEGGVFWCIDLIIRRAKTPPELVLEEQKRREFRVKLEALMRAHRIAQVSASLLQEI